jgi:RNA polymerase sigma-70 factor (ECF subfamily)
MSTASALKGIQRNLDPEFERLFREHHAFVYRTAYSIAGRVEDADDVVQTVFLRLLRREFPPDLTKNPKAYLYRAAFNAAISVIRSRRRNDLESVENVDAPATPPVAVVDEDTRRQLYDAIAQLRPTSAQILILRYVHDYDLAEIAKTLGTTRGTVAVSLFRSRALLKKRIRAMRAKP